MFNQDQILIGAETVSRIYDTLPDGTKCIVLKPENWNGPLLAGSRKIQRLTGAFL